MDYAVFFAHLAEGFQHMAQLGVRVGGGIGGADQGLLGRDGGGHHGGGEDPHFAQFLGHGEGFHVVPHHQGNDGRVGVEGVPAHGLELGAHALDDFPEAFLAVRLALDDFQAFQDGGRVGGGQAGGEDEGPAVVAQIVDDLVGGGNETADGDEGLGEGPHDHVHVLLDAEMGAGAVPLGAQHPDGMGLVHHEAGAVFLLELDDLRQVANIPAHGEDPVGHDELGNVAVVGQDPFQVFHVVVDVLYRFGEGKLAAIHDARRGYPGRR